jgi:hypothetical protein
MKKKSFIIFVTSFMFACTSLFAQTTVAPGNWSSPMTWGGAPPAGTGTVVINHAVTLDMDYVHSAGSITIQSTGSLIGGNAMRFFGLNYPSGNADLNVTGELNIARMVFAAGNITNSGVIGADSLMNMATIVNNMGASFNVAQFANQTTGVFTNGGNFAGTNILNLATFTNSNIIQASNLLNCKSFTNVSAGILDLSNDFQNSDTLATPAVFENNGQVNVGNNWRNDELVTGASSGRFCVQNNSSNAGTMSGSFDFCDQTGGTVDLNTGVIDPLITICQFPCATDVESMNSMFDFLVYPNPASDAISIVADSEIQKIEVYTTDGSLVYSSNCFGRELLIQVSGYLSGTYLIVLTNHNGVVQHGRVLILK